MCAILSSVVLFFYILCLERRLYYLVQLMILHFKIVIWTWYSNWNLHTETTSNGAAQSIEHGGLHVYAAMPIAIFPVGITTTTFPINWKADEEEEKQSVILYFKFVIWTWHSNWNLHTETTSNGAAQSIEHGGLHVYAAMPIAIFPVGITTTTFPINWKADEEEEKQSLKQWGEILS